MTCAGKIKNIQVAGDHDHVRQAEVTTQVGAEAAVYQREDGAAGNTHYEHGGAGLGELAELVDRQGPDAGPHQRVREAAKHQEYDGHDA